MFLKWFAPPESPKPEPRPSYSFEDLRQLQEYSLRLLAIEQDEWRDAFLDQTLNLIQEMGLPRPTMRDRDAARRVAATSQLPGERAGARASLDAPTGLAPGIKDPQTNRVHWYGEGLSEEEYDLVRQTIDMRRADAGAGVGDD